MGAPRAIALCKCFSGALEYQAGNWDEAETVLAESIKLYRELGAASGEALAWQRLGVLQTARGQHEEAMKSFQEGLEVADRAMMRAHCQIRLFASMIRNRLIVDDLTAADQFYKLGLEMSVRHGNCVTCDALFFPVVVSLNLAKGNIKEAEEYCQRLEEAVDKYASSMWVAMANQSRGEVLAAQGLLEDALEKYDKAYKIYQKVGHNYEAARCLSATADLLDAKDASVEDQQAVTIRAQAQEIFERLGAAYPV
ncbi:MAG: tetratricopeptide repeat protein [Anaerolineales bacterium]